jgi:hypothetical protein
MKPAQPRATGTPATASVTVTSVLVGSLLIAQAAVGQDGASVVVDLGECVKLVVDHERFACYERRVAESTRSETERDKNVPESNSAEIGAAPESRSPAPLPSAAPLDLPEPQSLEERRSARAAERVQANEERAQRKATRDEPSEAEDPGFISSITQLRETVPNAWLVALDNGEVWEQIDPKPYRLREGMQVRIYASTWGSSHRLTAPDLNGFIRVRQRR